MLERALRSKFRFGRPGIPASAAMLVFAASAAAQQAGPPVPHDVVMALLRNYADPQLGSSGEPRLIVGALPPELGDRIGMPPQARIFGSVIGANGADIIGFAPITADSVRIWFAKDFERRGFTPAAGFQAPFRDPPAPAFRDIGSVAGYCDGFRHFSITARQISNQTAEFRLRISAAFAQCTSRNQSSYGIGGFRGDSAFLPKLLNPTAAESGGCQSGLPGMVGISTLFSASMPATEIIHHYGRQLEAMGWRADTVMQSAAASWVRPDSAGHQYRAEIAVLANPFMPACRSVQLRVLPPPLPPR